MTVNGSVQSLVKCPFSWLSRDGVRNSLCQLQNRGLEQGWSAFQLDVLAFLKSEDIRAEVYNVHTL